MHAMGQCFSQPPPLQRSAPSEGHTHAFEDELIGKRCHIAWKFGHERSKYRLPAKYRHSKPFDLDRRSDQFVGVEAQAPAKFEKHVFAVPSIDRFSSVNTVSDDVQAQNDISFPEDAVGQHRKSQDLLHATHRRETKNRDKTRLPRLPENSPTLRYCRPLEEIEEALLIEADANIALQEPFASVTFTTRPIANPDRLTPSFIAIPLPRVEEGLLKEPEKPMLIPSSPDEIPASMQAEPTIQPTQLSLGLVTQSQKDDLPTSPQSPISTGAESRLHSSGFPGTSQ